MKHVTILVRGKVQGVFYRHSAKQAADSFGVSGSASNESDGSVRIEAEGDESAVESLIAWCHVGPPSATVSSVDVRDGKITGMEGFSIR